MGYSATVDTTAPITIQLISKGNDVYDISFNAIPNAYWYVLNLEKVTGPNDLTYLAGYYIKTSLTNTFEDINMPALATSLGLTFGYYRIAIVAQNNDFIDIGLQSKSDYINSIDYGSGGGGGGGGGGAVCFLGSAPVLTPAGYKRIDSLSAGDMVRTADGRDVAIQRVKHQRVVTPSASVNPYVIPKGQFGATETLAISPRHCVAIPGRGMVEARDLGLRQMSMRAAFDYYNLELPEWDNMVVGGVEVESLAPTKRVTMTAAEFRGLVASQGLGRSASDLAKLSQIVEMLADGRVAVSLTQKKRRLA